MSYLSVEMQTLASARILFYLPPRAFKPPPKVRSAVVRLDVLDTSETEVDDREAFLALARAGFAAPRKRVRNSLAIGLRIPPSEADEILSRAGVDAEQRPANLTLADWREVYFAWRSQGSKEPGAEESRQPGERGMRTVAPAKINWTLEVLGRREDGYHEIKSVMQTIDLCDELWADWSG